MDGRRHGEFAWLAIAAYMASQASFFVTLYALYLFHREEAPALILVGVLVLGIIDGAANLTYNRDRRLHCAVLCGRLLFRFP